MAAITLGKGTATAITDADIDRLAVALKCHPADIEAIAQVESNGFGWFPDGRIKILFEKHWFYKLLPEAKRANAVKAGLARKNWISPAKGGYKDQDGADARYKLLERAARIDEEAAFGSVSVGTYQIMGFNHALCGHPTARAMFDAFCESEAHQLTALAGFLTKKGLLPALRSRDFDKIEQVYNGGGLGGAYAKKMRKASDKLRSGKWAGWKPEPARPAPQPAPQRPEPPPVAPKPAPTTLDDYEEGTWTPVPQPSAARGWIGLIILVFTAIAGFVSGAWQWLVNFLGF